MLLFVPLMAQLQHKNGDQWTAELSERGRVVPGSSGAMTDQKEIVWECHRQAPSSILLQLAATNGQEGFCDITEPYTPGTSEESMCKTQSKGSFSKLSMYVGHAGLAECAQRCAGCQNCNFFSFSPLHRDCSWFKECNMLNLSTVVHGFETYDVARMRKLSSDEDNPLKSRIAALTKGPPPGGDSDWLQKLQTHREHIHRDGSSAGVLMGMSDLHTLHHIIATLQPRVSGETGFASGGSALAMMTGLGREATHVAIDPFQGAYRYDGLRAARGYTASSGKG